MSNTNTVLVTGATDGIGKQTALELAHQGWHVIVHGRNDEKAGLARDHIIEETGSESVESVGFDLGSLDAIRHGAQVILDRFDQLDVLINNAGVFKNDRGLSEDGYELTFAVNHLAPFLLTHLLLDLLKECAPSRVVTVSSVAHSRGDLDFDNLQGEKRWGGYDAYSRSKLANVLFATELAERLEGTGVTSNSLHPGVIGTKLLRAGFGMDGASLEQGARTSVYLASSPDVEGVTGEYFVDCRQAKPNSLVQDEQLRKRFWDVSAEMCDPSG